jgi:RimJ/RimL family protein N-acetyltransferase
MSNPVDQFLVGKECFLSPVSCENLIDSEWLSSINNHEFSKNFPGVGYFPITYKQQCEYIESSHSKGDLIFGIYEKISFNFAGTVSLKNIDWVHRSADHSQMIFNKYRSFSLFYESNSLIINHAFNQLNLNRISGGSIEKSQVDLMRKFFGFRHEGVNKQVMYKNGSYHDAYMIGLIRDDFKK